ncbi:MAG: hypothetical protein R2831_10865 [Chitinophagaceae bacterium]
MNLAFAKKYLPSIVYSILGLVLLLMLYRFFIRMKSGANNVADIAINSQEETVIAQQTGVDKPRVSEMRKMAHDVAYELETLNTMGFIEKLTHFQTDSDTLNILKRAKSIDEMKIARAFYKNDFTAGNELLDDLKKTTLVFSINSIPYITALQ